jgi:poly-gamma-glutamate synthesis protein (capsule biosynthesis protein)
MDATAQIPARPGVNPLRVRPVFDVPAPVFAALQAIEAGLGHRARTGTYRRPRPVDSPDQLDFYGQRFRRAAEPRKAAAIEAADLARTLAAIRAARAEARFVIAYVHHHHWEAVWEDVPDWMRGFAHDCIDAGADLVASHGVPVVQGIEIYRGRPIFYSLGNFIFHSADPAGWHHADIWRSVIAECRFAADGSLAALGLSPIVLAGDVPLLALPNETDLLDKIVGLSAPFGTALRLADGRATLIR